MFQIDCHLWEVVAYESQLQLEVQLYQYFSINALNIQKPFMISFVICFRYGGRYRDDRHRGYEDRNKPATEYGSRGYYEFFY